MPRRERVGAIQRRILEVLEDGRAWRTPDLVSAVYRLPAEADGFVCVDFDGAPYQSAWRALQVWSAPGSRQVGRKHALLWMLPAAADARVRSRWDDLVRWLRTIERAPKRLEALRAGGLRGTLTVLEEEGFDEDELMQPKAMREIVRLLDPR